MSTPITPAVPAETPTEPITSKAEVPGATPETDALGAPGLAALKSEREAKAAAEKRATAAEARVREFEDRDKSEDEKRAERQAELERENAELRAEKTRSEVAAAKGVPASLLTGSTQAELEASADALVAFRGEQPKAEPAPEKKSYFIPDEGGIPALGKVDNISPGMGSLRAGYAQPKE